MVLCFRSVSDLIQPPAQAEPMEGQKMETATASNGQVAQWQIVRDMVKNLDQAQIDALIEAIDEAVQAICNNYEVA